MYQNRLVLDEVDMLLDDSYYGDVRMIVQSMGGLRQVRDCTFVFFLK
jgi:hypothetical protein